MMKRIKGIPPLEYSFSISKLVRVLKRFLRIWVGLKLNQPRVERAGTYQEKYVAMFSKSTTRGNSWFGGGFGQNDNDDNGNPLSNRAPLPQRIVDTWQEDAEMARQFLAGTNPVMIRVCDSPESQLPLALRRFLQEDRDDLLLLSSLVSEKRLLYASYEGLGKQTSDGKDRVLELSKRPHETHPPPYNKNEEEEDERYFYPAVIVFELEPTQRQELSILAIQLEANDPEAVVYTRDTTTAAEWLMAKTCVMVADSQYHEVGYEPLPPNLHLHSVRHRAHTALPLPPTTSNRLRPFLNHAPNSG